MRIFDSHAHYNDERFAAEYQGGAEQAIEDAFSAGVVGFINAGTNPETSRESIAIAEKYKNVYAAAGLHPEDAAAYGKDEIKKVLNSIGKLLVHEKVVAIGEIGLDYHWDTDRIIQHEVFDIQLSMAEEKNLPVIIYDRDAHGDTFDIIAAHPNVRGVMHSYSGSAEMAREYVRRGWYISFSGTISYKNAEKVREACRAVPTDRLLIETDCPYLPPVPNRGKINYSGYLVHTLSAMADARNEDEKRLAEATLENAENLFGINL